MTWKKNSGENHQDGGQNARNNEICCTSLFSGLVVRSSSKVLHISMCYRHLLLSKKLPMRHKQNHAFCSFRQVKHIRLRSGGRYEKAGGGLATHTRVIRFILRVLEYNVCTSGKQLAKQPTWFRRLCTCLLTYIGFDNGEVVYLQLHSSQQFQTFICSVFFS